MSPTRTVKKHGVFVSFLGLKGPGLLFAKSIAEYLQSINELSMLVTASKFSNFPNKDRFLNLRVPHNFKRLTDFILFPISFLKFISQLNRLRPKYLIVAMPSPTDILFTRVSKLFGVKIIRIIHDLRSHPGDIWPTEKAIANRISDSDLVCFLSNRVHEDFLSRNQNKPSIVVMHPVLPLKNEVNSSEIKFSKPFLLIIGRMRTYKGVAEFLETWENRSTLLDHSLAIVGEGNLDASIHEKVIMRNDIHLENYWVNDSMFHSYLKSAAIVVLPYLEATQSGIIPIAMALNKKIAVFNSGALPEQISGYPNGLVIDHFGSEASVMSALERLIMQNLVVVEGETSNFTCEIGHFSQQLWSAIRKI